MKDLEGAECESVVPFLLFSRFEPLLTIGIYGQSMGEVRLM